jgi:hypothetical protein
MIRASSIVLRSGIMLLVGTLLASDAVGEERSPKAIPRDLSKGQIEIPTERLLAAATAAKDSANPKVAPGRVRWHSDFTSACAASRKSGKPVLLFHMMGKLDDQFC